MQVKVIKTKKGAPMQVCDEYKITEDTGREWGLINLYPQVEYQEIKGFGGAFTEASSTTVDKLSKAHREEILKLYFDPVDGIGYNFCRTHINSCDFSLGNYTCVDEGDDTLETFQINRDKKSLIPMIKDAMKYGEIDMFASPWSPPAYMKTTGQMNLGGKLKEEYFDLWAEYYVKFIQAYENEGIKIGMITVQNEPKAVQKWDSCVYTAEEERDFVKNYLGKKMKDIGVKILFWDHNKERIIDRAQITIDEQTKEFFDGVAFHWYSGDHFGELDVFHKLYPDMDIIFSEGCYEYSRGVLDTVKIGERYAHDIIGNFNNYCNAFCDWNLVLDEKGGPNHVGNFCDAPIMADTQNDSFEIHDSYYYIGHFSKFVKKGAKRIGCSIFTDELETVAFKNPNGDVVAIVLNRTDWDKHFAFKVCGKMVEAKAEAHTIATYIITNDK